MLSWPKNLRTTLLNWFGKHRWPPFIKGSSRCPLYYVTVHAIYTRYFLRDNVNFPLKTSLLN